MIWSNTTTFHRTVITAPNVLLEQVRIIKSVILLIMFFNKINFKMFKWKCPTYIRSDATFLNLFYVFPFSAMPLSTTFSKVIFYMLYHISLFVKILVVENLCCYYLILRLIVFACYLNKTSKKHNAKIVW